MLTKRTKIEIALMDELLESMKRNEAYGARYLEIYEVIN